MQDSLNGSRGRAATFTKKTPSKLLMTLFSFLSLENELYGITVGYNE